MLAAEHTPAQQRIGHFQGMPGAASGALQIEARPLSRHPSQLQPGDRSSVGEMEEALLAMVRSLPLSHGSHLRSQSGRTRLPAPNIEDARLIVTLEACQHTVPVVEPQQRPGGDSPYVRSCLTQRDGALPHFQQAAHLLFPSGETPPNPTCGRAGLCARRNSEA